MVLDLYMLIAYVGQHSTSCHRDLIGCGVPNERISENIAP